jgi:hypothetical protein
VIGLSLGLKEEEEGRDRDNGRKEILLMKRFQQLINGVRERIGRIRYTFA